MNPLVQLKKPTSLILMAFLLASFGILPGAQAVVPAPDGGYPGLNTAEGQNALLSLTTGQGNTAVGWLALRSDIIGSFNTATGAGTLLANTGDNNTAAGAGALLSNTHGFDNTANGTFALFNNTDGSFNTANGFHALLNSTGGDNTALGFNAGYNVTTASNVICIGSNVLGANVSNGCYIGSIAGQTVGAGGSTCYVDNAGKLGVFPSARRFNTDIADMAGASEALLALRPVTFHYKPELDKTGIPQFGLVAEEVAKVNPDLVTHDAKGDIYTVRYEAVNVMLLNEFIKEHNEFLKERQTVQEQQKEIDLLKAELKEQRELIQKVNDKLELNKPAPQTVLKNQ